MTQVKICGVTSAIIVDACIESGADYVGFVFVERSPRFISIEDAVPLIEKVKHAGIKAVGLWQGDGSLPLSDVTQSGIDILQAHGTSVTNIGLPTWYAFGVDKRTDLPSDKMPYERLLLDAKPPRGSLNEGGHGISFDWSILRGWEAQNVWMLAGGLNPENVADAIELSGACAVDVSSGVERAKGQKDPKLIRAFIQNVKQASEKI